MINKLDSLFSDTANNMKRSAIREILKLTQRPNMISFAGGLPSPESFPIEAMKEIVIEVLEKEGPQALQYSATEGDPRLRELLVERYRKQGVQLEVDNLVISTGSQQALDLFGKLFLNPGDYVLCGLPSYLGAISAFTAYGAKMEGVAFDKYGMRSKELDEAIDRLQKEGKTVKFIYIIPDFQNPAGITMPKERRLEILEVAKKYDLPVMEDSPYREVRFEGEPQPLVYELDPDGRVITLGTFSKTFVPGYRLAWVMAHPKVIDKFVIAKQSADLCTPTFVQKIAARFLETGKLDENLKRIVATYKEKRDIMLEGFRTYMPKGVSWTEPEGGLFLFLTMPPQLDSDVVFEKALEKNVAFVAGSVFYCNDCGKNTMRINFSFATPEENREGVKRLAEVISSEMKAKGLL